MTNVEVSYDRSNPRPRTVLDGPKKRDRPMVVRFQHYVGHVSIGHDSWVRIETDGIGVTQAQTYDDAVLAWERRLGRKS